MKNIYSQKVMKKFLLTISLFFLLSLTAFAVDSNFEELKQQLLDQVPTATLTNCSQVLVPLYDIETIEFFEFLDQTFKNKSGTASLTNIAISRYAEYKRKINDIFVGINPGAEVGTQLTQSAEYTALVKCSQITEAYLAFAKSRMIEHIKNNSYQKRTVILLEKYQAIDNRLREFNISLAQTNAFFQTFKNRLPGFLKKCLVQ
jgi:hypothetical protein